MIPDTRDGHALRDGLAHPDVDLQTVKFSRAKDVANSILICIRDIGTGRIDFRNVQTVLDEIPDHWDVTDEHSRSFAVAKVHIGNMTIDCSLPRKEKKVKRGHRGFSVDTGSMTVREAAKRRDFTMNAMAWNPLTDEIIDPYDGRRDLNWHLLRATSPAFAEDPLRPLRGMQFAGRFMLSVIDPNTIEMCRSLAPEYNTLAKERIWGEWEKWATKSTLLAFGLSFIRLVNWLQFYPALENLVGLEQEPPWHPEGDAWTHTLYVTNYASREAEWEGLGGRDRTVLMLAALLHDVGKAVTTQIRGGKITTYAHDQEGVPIAAKFLDDIGCPKDIKYAWVRGTL